MSLFGLKSQYKFTYLKFINKRNYRKLLILYFTKIIKRHIHIGEYLSYNELCWIHQVVNLLFKKLFQS